MLYIQCTEVCCIYNVLKYAVYTVYNVLSVHFLLIFRWELRLTNAVDVCKEKGIKCGKCDTCTPKYIYTCIHIVHVHLNTFTCMYVHTLYMF